MPLGEQRRELSYFISAGFFLICLPDWFFFCTPVYPRQNAVVSQVKIRNLIAFGKRFHKESQAARTRDGNLLKPNLRSWKSVRSAFALPAPPPPPPPLPYPVSEVSSDIPSSFFPGICQHSRRDAASLYPCQSFDISSQCRLLHSVSRSRSLRLSVRVCAVMCACVYLTLAPYGVQSPV